MAQFDDFVLFLLVVRVVFGEEQFSEKSHFLLLEVLHDFVDDSLLFGGELFGVYTFDGSVDELLGENVVDEHGFVLDVLDFYLVELGEFLQYFGEKLRVLQLFVRGVVEICDFLLHSVVLIGEIALWS